MRSKLTNIWVWQNWLKHTWGLGISHTFIFQIECLTFAMWYFVFSVFPMPFLSSLFDNQCKLFFVWKKTHTHSDSLRIFSTIIRLLNIFDPISDPKHISRKSPEIYFQKGLSRNISGSIFQDRITLPLFMVFLLIVWHIKQDDSSLLTFQRKLQHKQI